METILYQAKVLYQRTKINPKYKIILESLVNSYYMNLSCNHLEFQDKGYYRLNNGEYIVADRNTANFRMLKCLECGETIYLLRTLNDNWDKLYKRKPVEIHQKVKTKIL